VRDSYFLECLTQWEQPDEQPRLREIARKYNTEIDSVHLKIKSKCPVIGPNAPRETVLPVPAEFAPPMIATDSCAQRRASNSVAA
jgi:hypothetical protein